MPECFFRYTSFESFVDMVQRQALSLVNFARWEDPYEGFLFKVAESQEGQRRILDVLKKYGDLAMPYLIMLTKFSKTIFGQSWSLCPESDALWRIYSHDNKSLRIEIRKENIEKLQEVSIHKIDYVNEMNIERQLDNIIDLERRSINLGKMLIYKRREFSHEQEVRLISHIESSNVSEDNHFPVEGLKALLLAGKITQEEYSTAISEPTFELKIVKYVSFGEIDNFIESVMLHPLSPEWMDEMVKDFCARNSINYFGKSKLYTLQY